MAFPKSDLDRIDEMERDEALATLASRARELLRQRDALAAELRNAVRCYERDAVASRAADPSIIGFMVTITKGQAERWRSVLRKIEEGH